MGGGCNGRPRSPSGAGGQGRGGGLLTGSDESGRPPKLFRPPPTPHGSAFGRPRVMHGCIVQRSHGGSVEEGCGVGSALEGVNGGVLRLPAPTVSAQGARTHRTVVTGHDEVHGARDSRDCAVRQSEDREVERGDPGIPSNMGRHLPRCVRPPTPNLDRRP